MADPLVKIQWKNNSRPAMNETNLNAMQTNIETYVEDNMEEMQRKVDGVVKGMPIGSGCDYFGSTAPEDFMFADGSAISRTTYAELFAIIGTTYGAGDGSTTFNLPDKRERVSVTYKSSGTFNQLGKTGGEEKHTLTVNEMPAHNHQLMSQDSGGGGAYNNWHAEFKFAYNTNVNNVQSNSNRVVTASGPTSGGGQSHNILQPYIVCNYIIRVK